MPNGFVKKKIINARSQKNFSPHQVRMLELATSREIGMVPLRWFTMRTARVLERRGLGDVRNRFDHPDGGWSILGWVFVVNEAGRALVKESENGY